MIEQLQKRSIFLMYIEAVNLELDIVRPRATGQGPGHEVA